MNNLKTLLKYNIINGLGINKFKKNKFKQSSLEITLAIVGLAIFAFITGYMFLFVELFREVNAQDYIWMFAITIASVITFFSTITKANAYIFRTKDYDLLMSLPVETKTIVAVKLLSLYIINCLFVFALFLGIDIAYFVLCGFDALKLISSLVLMIFVPLFPIVISSFVAFLLGFIPMKQKVRNILSTLLYLIFVVALLIFYAVTMTMSDAELTNGMTGIYAVVSKYYFMVDWGYRAIVNGEWLYLLFFILVSTVAALIFVIVVAKCFLKFNNLLARDTMSNYNLSKQEYKKENSAIKTLFKKEFKVYVGTNALLINTIVGPILSIITVVMFALKYDDVVAVITELNESLPFEITIDFFLIIISLVIVFCISLTSTTASAISMEGKSFWIIKTAPVKPKEVFISKSLINLLLNGPIVIIDIIAAGIILKAKPLFVVFCTLTPLAYVFAATFFGLYFNIIKPNFEFDNPARVVKQGTPVLLSMLLSFLVVIISFVLLFVLLMFMDIIFVSIIEVIIALVFALIGGLLLFKKGIKKYDLIEC